MLAALALTHFQSFSLLSGEIHSGPTILRMLPQKLVGPYMNSTQYECVRVSVLALFTYVMCKAISSLFSFSI